MKSRFAILRLLELCWFVVMFYFGFLPLVRLLFLYLHEWIVRRDAFDPFLILILLLILLCYSLKQLHIFSLCTGDSAEEFCIDTKGDFTSFITYYFGNISSRFKIIWLGEGQVIRRVSTVVLNAGVDFSEFKGCPRTIQMISIVQINMEGVGCFFFNFDPEIYAFVRRSELSLINVTGIVVNFCYSYHFELI